MFTDYSFIDRIMEEHRTQGYYPDAVCHIFDKDKTLYHAAYGSAEKDNRFDMASVSKIVCTTMLLFAMEEKGISPDDMALGFLPNEKLGSTTKERLSGISLKQLLTHTSGIVPWFPFYSDGREFYTVLERVLSSTPKEEGMAYSDLNFMLLGLIFGEISGLTLREGLEHYIKGKLNINEIAYGPIEPALCAPTCYGNQIEQEMCRVRGLSFDGWRTDGVKVQGSCNDGNAFYYWHGASGHAGIFASSSAMVRLCQFYMNTERPLFLRAMAETVCERGLGFDKTDVFPEGVGHTGFTGTSIWLSKANNIGAVILTNKYFRKEGEPTGSSHDFRRAVHYGLLGKTYSPKV